MEGTRRQPPRPPRPARHRLVALAVAAASLLVAGCTETVTGTARVAADARPSPTPSPTPTLPGSQCPQAGVPTSATALSRAVLPASPDRLPLGKGMTGPLNLEAFLANPSVQGIPGSHEFLTSVGFVGGYFRTWTRGQIGQPRSRTESVTIYQFADTAGACAYSAWSTRSFHLRPVPRDAAMGVTGSQFSGNDSVHVSSYVAPKGRFVVLTGLVIDGPRPGPLGTVGLDLLEAQYRRL